MDPLISIITVTYNAASLISSTMKSVASQSFRDYEHIIVDGASIDGTLAKVSEMMIPNVSVHSKPDNGIYHAMNRGLEYAKGKYVIFLNAGDRFASSTTLAKYAESFKDDPDIIYGDTVITDIDDNILRPRHLSAPVVLTINSYLKGMLICHQAFMVRKNIAPKYSRTYKLSADYEWCLKCIANSKVTKRVNLKEVTIHYLEGGISGKQRLRSLKERFMIMKEYFGTFPAIRSHLSFLPRVIRSLFKTKALI